MRTLGHSQQAIVSSSYPHFLVNDSLTWTRYLENPLRPIKEVWYDIHVGGSMGLPAGAGELEARIAAGVSRKRIDVVAAVGQGYWIIEVKPFASTVALGQILTYARLFNEEFIVDGAVWPVIIADEVDEDLRFGFEQLGVVVILT